MQYDWFGSRYDSRPLLILMLGLVAGMGLDRTVTWGFMPTDKQFNFRLVSEANNIIHRFYVDRAAEQSPVLTYGAISGMVDALGDTGHSRFLSPPMVKELADLERNKFQGIGAEVQSKGGHILIVAPLDGSPAQRAGLKPGDIILQVDGHDATGKPLDQVVKEIAGKPGTSVILTILTPVTGRTREITLTRETFHIHNVTWQELPGTKTAQLRIAAFDKGVGSELRETLKEIKREKVTGLVLDLRNNPGGLLDEAVACASQFLKGGNVLLEKDAQGVEKPVPAKAGGEATEIPLTVLVNGGTASAAEIVAGALRDAHRASLLGETTFGTGTVLTEFRLSDGSALLLAIEEWLTPSGDVIWHKGITPNIVVALAAGAFPVFPEAEHTMTAKQLQESGDTQLLRGMETLR
ncbi:MAG TPA: S41 family peptidase [Candidatus Sulfotelmatobacter sp.]|nr:S41 family peptidase [Candidatus Sulfotelmatobacter sp.]